MQVLYLFYLFCINVFITCVTLICINYLSSEVLLTSAEKLVCTLFLFISHSLMVLFQISAADWGQAETTYNLYEVLFKVHKVSSERSPVIGHPGCSKYN